MLKNFQKWNFWKEHRKRPKKMGWMPKFDELFRKLWPNENFGSLTSIFDVNFTQNLRNIELSQAKRLSYLLELFCWHILGGFKKNPRNGFSAVQKTAKNGFFSHKSAAFVKTGKNLKKAAVLRFLHFLPPTSCRVSEKSSERFLR